MKNLIFLTLILFILISVQAGCEEKAQKKQDSEEMAKYEILRQQMVENQIKKRGVADTLVLEAMRKVPRQKFVPSNVREKAYQDSPLPIGFNQTISQPYIVAFMTEALELKGDERILEIGTGSGYQAAVLGEIVDSVYTIEIICGLLERAGKTLDSLGYDNVITKCGDGYKGWKEYAPFDGIIVTAAPEHIPQPLIDQLKPGGRMILPVGDFWQDLVLVTKKEDGTISKREVLPVRFVPMTGEAQEKEK